VSKNEVAANEPKANERNEIGGANSGRKGELVSPRMTRKFEFNRPWSIKPALMELLYDAELHVKLHGEIYIAHINLLDLSREFQCPVCITIGEDEKISLQSLSDHLARHYLENNRVSKINAAISEDLKAEPSRGASEIHDIAEKYDRAVENVIMRKPPVHPRELTEEEMLEIAMAESLRETVPTVLTAAPVPTAAVAPVTTLTIPTVQPIIPIIYPPRKKKGSDP
jgi:hypothetical protein